MAPMERTSRHLIGEAIKSDALAQPFHSVDVNLAFGIDYAGVFLHKHRVGNSEGFSERFVQI
jgi:hypothetical protein